MTHRVGLSHSQVLNLQIHALAKCVFYPKINSHCVSQSFRDMLRAKKNLSC